MPPRRSNVSGNTLRRAPGLVTAVIDGEAVVFETATARLHRLNPVATAVWEAIDGVTESEAIVARLAPDRADDIRTFLAELTALRLAE
jgi:hypothetical protein